ncbi:UDP-2,3-diacylglucosamine pyrophosphatase LpxH/glycosyltransferase involved in cell wall biosynthesis [Haloferula luteola]|uniref:UDP-2,3-diacylglucosamine pyrophosphatase LpxH/glycosyltransferase involved in cell wall biosynthesis n=1 Tax=Haloferula luteola TaxID=595692 RepID=A0A840UV85_9BACT|nr:glycosyltransferase [Haloferula luteola]MBB5350107.1 UDP-2,3-diacylglucosamine pyrophosphatase LpxH/glycosyltransferase involved in cell wall biosynthesis [Haloferula luteola]
MRVDIITDTYVPDINGVAMTLGRLASGLRSKGHLVHVICSGETQEAGQTPVAAITLPGYKEVRVGLPGPFKLRKRWMKRRPDAIYVATESPLGVSAIKAANSLGIPVATGFHTNFHQYMEQYRLGSLQPATMAWLKRVHRKAAVTLAPTPDVVEALRAEGFENVALLGRGVDTELFHPERRDGSLRTAWGAREGSPVALVVGRVAPEKNLPLAMDCFRKMRERVPDLQCVCVGDGPVKEALSSKYPFVHWVGVKSGDELAAHYASADILLFPSETETFGNVLLEGMASGLVTVSYDYAASARYIDHGANGLKAKKGDDDQFRALAVETLQHWQGDMRGTARLSVEGLGWDRVVETFEGELERIARGDELRPLGLKERRKVGKMSVRTVFLSDIHLGTVESKVHEVTDFIEHLRCEKLVLNGDIVDGWALRRGAKWRKRHSRFVRKVLKKTEKENTEVIYCRGNHDDILDRFLPLAFGSIRFVKEHIHLGADGKRYLVVHGDGFDSVSTRHKWLAVVGALGYDSMLVINRWYNRWRAWRGKEYFSLSKKVKAKVKSAVSFVDNYELQLQEYARRRGCDGIICGHIHTPEDREVGGIRYLNSGDWVESLTAILEHHDGRMELVHYEEFMARLGAEAVESATRERQGDGDPVALSA